MEQVKPSWANAPEWAGYLAKDEDGDWYWYEYEPEAERRYWFTGDGGGRHERAGAGWKHSLESRP